MYLLILVQHIFVYLNDHITSHVFYNLYNDNHILLLPAGHVFSEATIAKLKQYEREHKRQFEIVIENENSEETNYLSRIF